MKLKKPTITELHTFMVENNFDCEHVAEICSVNISTVKKWVKEDERRPGVSQMPAGMWDLLNLRSGIDLRDIKFGISAGDACANIQDFFKKYGTEFDLR